MPSDPVVEALAKALRMWMDQGYIDADGDDCSAADYSPFSHDASQIALAAYEATRGCEGQPKFCQPGDITGRRWLVTFDDNDMSNVVFEDEREACAFFESATQNWNCYLWGVAERKPAPPVLAKEIEPRRHNWVKSQLGHGETMCSVCSITNLEAAVLGRSEECEGPYVPAKESE